MENKSVIVSASRSNVFVRAIATTLVALMGIAGLATPASATESVALVSADVTASGGSNSLALLTGKSKVVSITSATTLVTGGAVTTDSTNSDISIQESVNPVNGTATFNITGTSATAEAAVITFSAAGRTELVVNVTVTDPALNSRSLNLNMRPLSNEIVTITSTDLALPSDAEITAVSSDSDLITVTDAVTPSSGSAAFTVNALAATSGTETITFQSLNYQDVVVNISVGNAMSSTRFVVANSANTLSLKTGRSASFSISGSLTAITTDSTNADITIQSSVTPVDGIATFNIVASSATSEDAVITFKATNRDDLVLNVSVADPLLKATLQASASSLNIRVGSYQTAKITSDELGLPSDAEVTAVSSDSDLVTVTDAVTPTSGSAAFRVEAVGLTTGTETVTFQSLNYQDVVVNVTTFDELKSSSFTDGQSGSKTLSLTTGQSFTAQISSYLVLRSTEAVTTDTTNADITVQQSVNPVNGTATFTIVGTSATTEAAVLTFSSAFSRTSLVVYVTVTDPRLKKSVASLNIRPGSPQTVTITSDDLALPSDAEVTAVSSDSDLVTVTDAVTPSSGSAAFTVSAVGLTSGTETVTFQSLNYQDIVVNVTTFDDLKSSSFTDGQSGAKTLNLETGQSVTAQISAYLALKSDNPLTVGVNEAQPVTVVSTKTGLTIEQSVNPVDGVATFNISSSTAGSGTLTFSAAGRTSLVVYVTVIVPILASTDFVVANNANSLDLKTGSSATLQVSGSFTAITTDSNNSDISIEQSVNPVNGVATFNIVGSSATTEAAVVTFSAANRTPLVVSVTVTDPRLKSSVAALSMRVGSYRTVTITSDELGLPSDAEITAVSSDSDLITVTDAVTPTAGSASFRVDAIRATTSTETITFQSLNYQDIVVDVTARNGLASTDLVAGVNDSFSLSLKTGRAASLRISQFVESGSTAKAVTTDSTNADISIEQSVNPVNGLATFNIVGNTATSEAAVVTFKVDGLPELAVNVTVTDPKLKSSVSNLNVRPGSPQTVTITSDELGLTSDAEITAVSSDSDLVTVTDAVTPSSGSAAFTVSAAGLTSGTETVTFQSLNYQDIVVNVTTFDDLKSSSFTDGLSGAKTLNVVSGESATAQISAYLKLKTTEPVTVTKAGLTGLTVQSSVNPDNNGVATFNISSSTAGSGTLTFSAAGRTNLVVNVTVAQGFVTYASGGEARLEGISLGERNTVVINTTGLVEVAGLSNTPSVVRVERVGSSRNTFRVTGVSEGSANISFTADGAASLITAVVVTKAALAVEETSLDMYTTGTKSFYVTSVDFPVGSATTLVATVDGAEDPAVAATFDGATVTIKGLAVGSAKVTIADENANYVPVVIDVTVETPTLSADASSYEVYYGQFDSIRVSSNELALMADDTVTVSSSDEDVLSFDLPPTFVAGSGSGDSGFQFPIYGKKAGSTVVTFSREGFEPVVVTVSVEKPSLTADLSQSSIFVTDKATVVITSDQQPISEEDLAMIAVSSDGEVLDVGVATLDADAHSATFEIEGLKAGNGSVTFSLDNYEDATVQLAVSVPALKAEATSVKAVIGVPLSIDISSDDKSLGDAVVTATTTSGLTVGEDCLGTNTGQVVASGDVSTVSICAQQKGSYTLTVSADGFSPVSVRVVAVAPALKSEESKVSAFVGGSGEVRISADELDLTGDYSVAASTVEGINFMDSSVAGNDQGVAEFMFRATRPGVFKVTFTSAGFKPVNVSIVVTRPELLADVSSVTVNKGGSVQFTVSSNDVDLATDLQLGTVVADNGLGRAVADPAADGEAVVKFTAAMVGKGTITISYPNFKSVTIKVTVAPARLEVAADALVSVVNGHTKITVTSPDVTDLDPASITATPVKNGIVTVTLSDDSEAGKAIFDVTGSAKGSTKINFTGEGFSTASIPVKINLAALVASTTSVQMSAGATATVTISSPDFPYVDGTGGLSETSGLDVTPAGSAIQFVSTSYIEEGKEGQAVITIKGIAKGRDKLVVSGPGFQKVSVVVNVVQPAMVTNVNSVSFRADGSATIKVSSKDLPFTNETTFTVEGVDGVGIDGVPVIDDMSGIATITLTAPEVTEKLSGTLVILSENYKNKSVKVVVTPAPFCVDKALGQIKFGDTDAKLSAASKASIARFAADLVNNKCASATLTSYVPVANSKANAAKYAKEVQLSAARYGAVKSALAAEVTKLRGQVVITEIKGSITGVAGLSSAQQSSYRRVEVSAKASSSSMMMRSRH